MRRDGLMIGLLTLALSACSRHSPTATENGSGSSVGNAGLSAPSAARRGNGNRLGNPTGDERSRPVAPADLFPNTSASDLRRQQFRIATFRTGLEMLAAHRFEEALITFGAIDHVDPIVQSLMSRSKRQWEREAIAAAITNDIQGVLDAGKPDEAAKLAVQTLRQFGATGAASRLLTLKRQADALIAAAEPSPLEAGGPRPADAIRDERLNRLRHEAEQEQDKRIALLDLEQAIRLGGKEEIRSLYLKACQELRRYDQARAAAAQLQKTPVHFEEAIAALGEAKKIWDNKEIREEIEVLRWRSLVRRDRLAVVDFDVLGDVGIAGAGALIADELQPAFLQQFDIQDRRELTEAIASLNLRSTLAASDIALREVGSLVRARYLVTGSIAPVAGLTIQAQMVDTRSGMIVHTARMVVQSADELIRQLPQLAADLLLNDEDREALDRRRVDAAVDVSPSDPLESPLPLSELDPKLQPAPIIPAWPKSPHFGGLTPQQLDTLPPPPPLGQVIALPVIPIDRDQVLRGRAVAAAFELGDNLYHRKMFREALARYEYAMSLAPERADVRRRVDQCRARVPPTANANPNADGRMRLAVFDFIAPENPKFVPMNLHAWLPESLAPYFAAEYRIADRAEVFWWMNRLGISIPEALNDFLARQYLSRALDVRFFLVGSVVITDGVDVTTYLVDAERGFVTGSGRTLIHEPQQTKLRLSSLRMHLKELAERTMMSPEQRRTAESQDCERDLLINDALREMARSSGLPSAIEQCRKWLKIQPDNVQLHLILSEAERRLEIEDVFGSMEPDGKISSERLDETQRHYLSLADDARRLRLEADRGTAAFAEADRQRLYTRRRIAAAQILGLAESLLDSRCASAAMTNCDAAIRLSTDQAVIDKMTNLCIKLLPETRAEELAWESQREAEARRQRGSEIQSAFHRLAAGRLERDTVQAARRKTGDDRDRRESNQLLVLARQLNKTRQFDEALAAMQIVLLLDPSAQNKEFANDVLLNLIRANAELRGAKAKADIERDLAAEQAVRVTAEADAENNRKLFDQLAAEGRLSLSEGKLDDAVAKFRKAAEIYQTDAVLAELQQVKAARARAETIAKSARDAEAERQRRADALSTKLTEARAAMAGQRFEQAIARWREAWTIEPSNAEAAVGLLRAQSGQDLALTRSWQERAENDRRRTFQALLDGGRRDLAKSKLVAAGAFGAIVRMYPESQEAATVLAEAQRLFGSESVLTVNDNGVAEQFTNAVRDGCWFRVAGLYERAAEMFRVACSVLLDEYAANEFELEAEKLVNGINEARNATILAKIREVDKADQLSQVIERFHSDLAAGDSNEAEQEFLEAIRLNRDDPSVVQAQASFQQLRAAEAAVAARDAQRRQQFDERMKRARVAMQARSYAEAAKAFASALVLFSQDVDARRELVEAEKMLATPQ